MHPGSDDKEAILEKVYKLPITNAENSLTPRFGHDLAATPVFEAMYTDAIELDKLSKFPCSLNYGIYRDLELRYADKNVRGGTVMRTIFRVANWHPTCQQCLYAFEIDTYGRGCAHECVYCYAKAELTVHGSWNNPIPVPIDFNEVRRTFYNVFETDKRSRYRSILEKRIPLRIGSMSDSFMWSDRKYKVTQELLKLLKFYQYPHVIFTRSDLVAHDEYIPLLDSKLCSVQFSLSSTNDDLNRKIEPGAPSAERRLKAAQKLMKNGLWTTVRINPLFPIRPDGYFTDSAFKWSGEVPKFNFSSFEMIDEIADHDVKSILVGFVRLSSFAINNIERATGFNLRAFYRRDKVAKSSRDFHYSDQEIAYYYHQLRNRCIKRGVEFSTCYIGNGDDHFWKDQELWSNPADCCNVKGRVEGFVANSRQIPFAERLKFTPHKDVTMSDRIDLPLTEDRPGLLFSTDNIPIGISNETTRD